MTFKPGDKVIATSKVAVDELEEARVEIETSVGRALSSWSIIEMELRDFFLVLHEGEVGINPVLGFVFDGVRSIDVRLGMLDNSIVNDPRNEQIFVGAWSGLKRKLEKSVRMRNELAHFQIVVDHTTPGPPRPMLYPFFSISAQINERGPNPLGRRDIESRVKSFDDLKHRLRRYTDYVRVVRGKLQPEARSVSKPEHLLENPFVETVDRS